MPLVALKLFQVFPKRGDAQNFRSDVATDESATTLLAVDSSGNVVQKTEGNISVSWDEIDDKPSTFNPSSHTHDDRYYTETEVDALLADTDTLFGDYSESGVDYEVKTPVGIDGAIFTMKATATIDVTVAGAGTIDGETSVTLYEGEALLLRSNGTEWMVS
jgi:hypothetical protein